VLGCTAAVFWEKKTRSGQHIFPQQAAGLERFPRQQQVFFIWRGVGWGQFPITSAVELCRLPGKCFLPVLWVDVGNLKETETFTPLFSV
jgi:hypothetical protein